MSKAFRQPFTLALTAPALLFAAGAASAEEAPAAAAPADATVTADAPKDGGDGESSDPTKDGEEDKNPFPLSFSLDLSQSLGSGVLPPMTPRWSGTYMPSTGSSMTPTLVLSVPTFDVLPKMSLMTTLDVSIEWLSTYGSGAWDRVPRLSDSTTKLSFPGLYKEEITNISFSLSTGVRLPLSLQSQLANGVANFSLGGSVAWDSSKLEVLPEWLGDFNVAFAPGVSAWTYSSAVKSVPCDATAFSSTGLPLGDAVGQLDRLPLRVVRSGEVLDNGECVISGRQGIAGASLPLSAGWSLGKHSVGLSLGLIYSVLRPNELGDEFSSAFSTNQDFSELTTGSLSYTYSIPMEALSLPIDTSAALTAGVTSLQPAFTGNNQMLRFPIFDFYSPQNNFSAAYLNLSLGI